MYVPVGAQQEVAVTRACFRALRLSPGICRPSRPDRPAAYPRPWGGIWLLYSPAVSSDLWFGALTTLAGAALGGASTYLVSRLQIRESRAQRAEAERWDRARRNVDRRFGAYANFLTDARGYRNAIRPYRPGSGPGMTIQEIDDAARAATAAGSLVFLVYDNRVTEAACRSVLRAIRDTAGVIHERAPDLDGVPWQQLNDDMARVLRDFEAAARTELEVTGDGAGGRPPDRPELIQDRFLARETPPPRRARGRRQKRMEARLRGNAL